MSNILNSQNSNINHEIASTKIGKNNSTSRYVEAPQSLPRYSIHKILQEKDEFRKNITNKQNKELNKKKDNNFSKLGFIIATISAFFLLRGKKIKR